jgi:hypothetical protein
VSIYWHRWIYRMWTPHCWNFKMFVHILKQNTVLTKVWIFKFLISLIFNSPKKSLITFLETQSFNSNNNVMPASLMMALPQWSTVLHMFIVTGNAVTATYCKATGSTVHPQQMIPKNKCAVLFYIKSISPPMFLCYSNLTL